MTAATTAVRLPALRRRTRLLALTALLAGTDLAIKAWADRALPGDPIEGGPIDLRLTYNPGVSFSVAENAPPAVVVAVTGLITAAIAVVLWRTARTGGRTAGVALAAVLGGAIANLLDRAPDGKVTDYLHTGWWPTFNLADVFIVCGALVFAVQYLRPTASRPHIP